MASKKKWWNEKLEAHVAVDPSLPAGAVPLEAADAAVMNAIKELLLRVEVGAATTKSQIDTTMLNQCLRCVSGRRKTIGKARMVLKKLLNGEQLVIRHPHKFFTRSGMIEITAPIDVSTLLWLWNEARPTPPSSVPVECYFVVTADGTACKIGIAKDPERRLRELQTSHPQKLSLYLRLPGSRTLERSFHSRFAAHRISGEWFEWPAIKGDVDGLVQHGE